MKYLKPFYALGLVLTLVLAGCSAERLMQRAIKKDPTLVTTRTDTVRIAATGVDTSLAIKKDTTDVLRMIDSILYKYEFDTLPVYEFIKKDIVNYIIERQCLTDTLSFNKRLSTDSLTLALEVKVFEENDSVKVSVKLDDIVYLYNLKSVSVTNDSWLNKTGEILMFIFILILILGYALSLRR